jgi:hypothetical protein
MGRLFEVRYKFENNEGRAENVLIFGPCTLKAAIVHKRRQCTLLDGSIGEYWAEHLHVEVAN